MWGLAPVATRALVLQLPPLPLLVIRMAVASVVLLPWCRPLLRRPVPPLPVPRHPLPPCPVPHRPVLHRPAGRRSGRRLLTRLVMAGLLGMVGYNLPVTVGLQWVPASTAGLVLASEPAWLLVLAAVFLGERASRRSWAGVAVALGGVAVLAGPGILSARGGARELAGVGLIALGTLLFGAYTLMLRPLSQAYGPVPVTAASTVAGALFYAPFAALISPAQLTRLPASAWAELAFLAIGSTALGMLAWNLAVSRLPGERAGLLLFLEPVVSVAGAVTLLGEHLSAQLAVGGALVLAGIAATWRPNPRPPDALPSPSGHPHPDARPPPSASRAPDARPPPSAPGCGPPPSGSGPFAARTCPSAGRRHAAASPPPSKPRPISREVRADQPATPPAPGAPIRTFPPNRSNAHSNKPLNGICS
jgi:drug/metabolite transporter (DMT)-like permease